MLGGVVNGLDLVYVAGLVLASPYWLVVPQARAKVLRTLRERVPGRQAVGAGPGRPASRGGVLIHAVSLGEINATRTLVAELQARRPDLPVTVTATTATGYARAVELYGGYGVAPAGERGADGEAGGNADDAGEPGKPRVRVDRYPLDFSWAVGRFLDRHRPEVVVLMELELWPNFLRACEQRGIAVMVVNGRLTEHSMRRYRWIGPVSRRMLKRVGLVCVQDETYRERFIAAGASPDRVEVTGSMKFDTAQLAVEPAAVERMRGAVGLTGGRPVWVCGSTGPGEERVCLEVYRRLVRELPGLRLVIVPRKPERFGEVAGLIQEMGFGVVRRSSRELGRGDEVVLGDTVGELRVFYALADVVFVGRSLVDLGPKQHGSDMLEAAALGKPVIVGPYTGNFADAMGLLRRGGGVVEVPDAAGLERELRRVLSDRASAAALGERARRVVEAGRGATARHADRILRRLAAG